jgi:hypothetical protein
VFYLFAFICIFANEGRVTSMEWKKVKERHMEWNGVNDVEWMGYTRSVAFQTNLFNRQRPHLVSSDVDLMMME